MDLLTLTVSGAYGRDYKSGKAAKADWEADKDFVVRGLGSGYVNKSDVARMGEKAPRWVNIRYKKNDTQVCVIDMRKVTTAGRKRGRAGIGTPVETAAEWGKNVGCPICLMYDGYHEGAKDHADDCPAKSLG